ncbi:hypothetical protein PUNSTDRAFT_61905 [Punctularia strigosozonata HHB-11173 SS5]|uniref:uncharacterized protein n=1 Tax=Punctularia strigosozonata (strain HHB-11173) TaxID=741275 RepID=UPI000441641F|nr:uncharacterized protein PUNSTDRAFT_61905 [Punctularia strigosozonata HHB-11173 SS5]EIN11240.1 hypothetical protein PUNSTDRAFT_61905 [Punctularia strigosozonata HHB-11173 SS5]
MPTIPLLWRNILKCAVAYFIGSLFTFSPYLSRFITDVTSSGEKRPSPSGHMVATVAVYFNPAKTAGGMIEADIFCLLGLFWAAFVSLGSMASFWFFEVRRGWEWLADALGLLWVGVGMSLMAFAKVKMAKPSFNPACSMAAIILFVVVVKEGGLQTLFQVSVIVFTGTVVANVVCFCLWPQSATAQLQANMVGTLDSFATLLRMITAAFLLEGAPGDGERLKRAVESHERSFTVLKKNLGEARREVGGPGTAGKRGEERGKRQVLGRAYEDAVDCLNRLGQHLNGLRGGTTLQYELTKALRDGRLRPEGAPEVKGKVPGGEGDDKGAPPTTEEEAMLRAAAIMFGDLIDDLGPPLKALSSTCVGSLKELREAFLRVSDRDGAAFRARTFQELDASIKRALYTFESTSNHALMRLYQKSVQSDYAGAHAEQHRARESVASFTGVGNESENLFLVYFFIFTLQEFAGELLALVDAVGRIYEVEREAMMRGPWWKRMFTGPWQRVRELFRRSEAPSFILPGSGVRQIAFPKVRPHAPNTKQTPARADLPFWGRVKQAVWAAGSRLRENDAKYGVKTGLATAMLAAPAFFEATRPVFLEYRGEWALISFFVVMSPTIGATNNLSIHRVLGTIFGAATAAGIWTLFPENAVVLSIFGFFYSIPCFYIIVAKPALATTGRFLLLTYNLTCYNLRQRDVSVIDIAVHRSTAVIVGVLWAFLVSRFWWPTEARRELSKKLGDFCLNLGWLYTRLVAHNSFATDPPRVTNGEDDNDDDDDDHPTEETSLLARKTAATKLNNSISEFMAMELHLQIQLIEMQGLLAQTAHEPRLKGPFPIQLYRNILTSLQTILDKLHSMRCVTTREECIRRDFIVPVNKERREMVGNIILYLSVLSSTFRLKAPLPPYLPPAAQSQERLVDAIRELEVVKNREVKGSRQLLFFAYALTMKGVIHELDYLGKTLQDAFGVIGQTTEEFEAMFRERPASEIQDSV